VCEVALSPRHLDLDQVCPKPSPGIDANDLKINVWGEPVFSVMESSWFCEKSGWIGKVEDVRPVLSKIYKKLVLKKTWISTGNHFEEEDFTRMNCEIGRFHPV
jgi:hypothetical protein